MTPPLKQRATICAATMLSLGIMLLARIGKYADDLTDFCVDTMPGIIESVRGTAGLTWLEKACDWEAGCMDQLAGCLGGGNGEECKDESREDSTDTRDTAMAGDTVPTAEPLSHVEDTRPDTAEPPPLPIADAGEPGDAIPADTGEQETARGIPADFTPMILDTGGREEAVAAVSKLPVKCKVIMAGDSMMEAFGPVFYRHMQHHRGMEFVLTARYSTGLCRPDFFDWPKNFRMVADETKPDIAIFYIGANDAMPIKVGKGSVYAGQPNWAPAYRDKVHEILDLASARQMTSLWLGLPVMGGKYSKLLHETTMTAKAAVGERNVPFLDVEPILADKDGNFQFYGPDVNGKTARLRTKDQCHITDDGNKVVIREFLPLFEKALLQHKIQHPELCIEGPLEDKAYTAPFKSILKFKPSRRK